MPITADLAAKLKASAAGRAPDAPLLLRIDGLRWQRHDTGDHLVRFRKAAIAAGAIVDGKPVSAYSLRHSSIVRMLLGNVPARLVASAHDTVARRIGKDLQRLHQRSRRRDSAPRFAGTARRQLTTKVVPFTGRRP